MQLLPTVPGELIRGGARNLDYDLMRMRAYLKSRTNPFMTGPYGLLSVGKDVKTVKGEKYGVRTGVLYLAPANLSGHELCQGRTKGCSKVCLWTAGHGAYHNVKEARLRKTMVFLYDRELFMKQLDADILKLKEDAASKNMHPAVRLNGTSDINWTKEDVFDHNYRNIFEVHRDVDFYDYTKRLEILRDGLDIPNYHLTFSMAETTKNRLDCRVAFNMGYNVTVVFGKKLPATYMGMPVSDGDRHDIRFWPLLKYDGGPVVIGLLAKGRARNDKSSGFVVWPGDEGYNQ
jgi:hypothetical protein